MMTSKAAVPQGTTVALDSYATTYLGIKMLIAIRGDR